jgi:hypothetical protein
MSAHSKVGQRLLVLRRFVWANREGSPDQASLPQAPGPSSTDARTVEAVEIAALALFYRHHRRFPPLPPSYCYPPRRTEQRSLPTLNDEEAGNRGIGGGVLSCGGAADCRDGVRRAWGGGDRSGAASSAKGSRIAPARSLRVIRKASGESLPGRASAEARPELAARSDAIQGDQEEAGTAAASGGEARSRRAQRAGAPRSSRMTRPSLMNVKRASPRSASRGPTALRHPEHPPRYRGRSFHTRAPTLCQLRRCADQLRPDNDFPTLEAPDRCLRSRPCPSCPHVVECPK